jgi:hypothetical protein
LSNGVIDAWQKLIELITNRHQLLTSLGSDGWYAIDRNARSRPILNWREQDKSLSHPIAIAFSCLWSVCRLLFLNPEIAPKSGFLLYRRLTVKNAEFLRISVRSRMSGGEAVKDGACEDWGSLFTLSACNAGVGPVGESGVANIINAFVEAGADSVVSWNARLSEEISAASLPQTVIDSSANDRCKGVADAR